MLDLFHRPWFPWVVRGGCAPPGVARGGCAPPGVVRGGCAPRSLWN